MKRSGLLLSGAAWALAALMLSACGGGGGGGGSRPGLVPAPPATPAPPPAPGPTASTVTIFPDPSPGEYASVGASIAAPGGNLDTHASADTRFGAVSNAAADQAQIRYSGNGYYEIRMPAAEWDRLVHYGGLGNPTADNNYFQPSGVPTNHGYLVVGNAAKSGGYTYSELGGWGSSAASRFGAMAFGIPTPAGGVPTSGSASFDGKVQGNADVMQLDGLYGGFVPLALDGTVTLNFDFGSGALAGEMSLYGRDGMNPFKIGTFAFRETVFSAGSTSYSGRFETGIAGDNFFLGRFTGPGAQETIGAWAVPFVFTSGGESVKADGQPHQAFGAWIARRN